MVAILIVVYCYSTYSDEFEKFKTTRSALYTWIHVELGFLIVSLVFYLSIYFTISPRNMQSFRRFGNLISLASLVIAIYGLDVINKPENYEKTAITKNDKKILAFCVNIVWFQAVGLFVIAFCCTCFCFMFCVFMCMAGG